MESLSLVRNLLAFIDQKQGTKSDFCILGIGNPILDISANVPIETINKYGLKLDNAILAEEKHLPLYKELITNYDVEFIPGGATLNTIRVAQWMLQSKESTAYIGCIGKDKYGSQLANGARDDGVSVHFLEDEKTPTGTCACLINNKERTLVANLSAANNYKDSHLDKCTTVWKNAGLYYSAGFFLTVSPSSMMRMAKYANEMGNLYCLNLSAPFLIQFLEKPMMELMPFVDILFGNESEALAFGQHHKFEDTSIKAIALKISKMSKVGAHSRFVIITQGSDAVIVAHEGKILEFPVPKISNIVDTNGAGDAFVGGFLAAKSRGLDLKKCVDAGIYSAGVILQVSGTTLTGTPEYDITKISLSNVDVLSHSVIAHAGKSTLGKKKIALAKNGMEGLLACYGELQSSKPFKKARISCFLPVNAHAGVLIEILTNLGAEIRLCSDNITNTQDDAAAAIAAAGVSVFSKKDESLEEYWWCVYQCLSWPNKGYPNLVLDQSGNAILLLHEGMKAEAQFKKNGLLPALTTDDPKLEIISSLLRNSIKKDPTHFTKIVSGISGVSGGNAIGISELHQMAKEGKLPFAAIDIDTVTKTRFDTQYGCQHSVADAIMRATDVMIAGKRVSICGFGEIGKGCAKSLLSAGARVFISEIDPICALQALMDGMNIKPLEDVAADIDIVVTATGNTGVVMASHMAKMKNNCIVGNIGGYGGEIDVAGLAKVPGIKKVMIKPDVHRWQFPDGHGVIVLAEGRPFNIVCSTGHPAIVLSCIYTNQLLAQLELYKGKYGKEIHVLPKILDEKVARLHANTYDARITELSAEQAEYIGVTAAGPYKPLTYRY